MRIILLGPPGAGKGTQAVMLSEHLKVAHISTGDILREELKKDSSLAKKARRFVESGGLVPDDIIIEVIKERISGLNDFLLDGFPRTIRQAQALDEALVNSRPIDLAIYLDASTPTIIQRLSGRRICSKCGANYHIKNMPPKAVGFCDKCGSILYQRPDDSEAPIKNRLAVYLKETASLIDYYQKQNKLLRISSDPDAGEVFKELIQALNSKVLK